MCDAMGQVRPDGSPRMAHRTDGALLPRLRALALLRRRPVLVASASFTGVRETCTEGDIAGTATGDTKNTADRVQYQGHRV